MRKPVRLGEPEFVSCTRIRKSTGCSHGTLLNLVKRGLVQVRLDHFTGRPLYRLADVRQHSPGKPGRPRKAKAIS
jgi:hypothetical protein